MSNSSASPLMIQHLIPDPALRERLLDHENLMFLASLYDFEAQTLEHMFANGMTAEDLLLELLKRETDPRRLSVQLDLKARDTKRTQTESQSAPSEPMPSEETLSKLERLMPDRGMRQRLLIKENLIFLAYLYDFSKSDLKQMIAKGLMPEDLLLEILKRESDPKRLIVQLKLRTEEIYKETQKAAKKAAQEQERWGKPLTAANSTPHEALLHTSRVWWARLCQFAEKYEATPLGQKWLRLRQFTEKHLTFLVT